MSGNSIEEQINNLNEKHAGVMIGGKFEIMNEIVDPIFGRPDITFSSVYHFKNRYANKKVLIGKKQVSVASLWLESDNRRDFDGIIFSPSSNIPGFYNLFRELSVKPKQGDWHLFDDHIREIIASGNWEIYEWILAWMARIVQDPGGERPGVCPVLRGLQGCGKGIFIKNFGSLFGPHFLHITNPSLITGRFNSHLKNALVVHADEAFWGGDKSAEGILKGMITEDTNMIEYKGKDAFAVKNHINLIISSNNEWVVPAGLEERRFFVIDVSDQRIRDYDYFNAISDQMKNGGREAMLNDLQTMQINSCNLRIYPRTEALLDQMINSMTSVGKFWFAQLVEGAPIVSQEIDQWHQDYIDFCNKQQIRYPKLKSQFGKELKKLCPSIRRERSSRKGYGFRPWVYVFESAEICRRQFENVVGMRVDWDECGSDTGYL